MTPPRMPDLADFRIAILVRGPRAALEISQSLENVRTHIDGPFRVWEGQFGLAHATLIAPDPGGADAWFAAAKLLIRRRRPALMAGASYFAWCGPEERPPELFAASSICDLSGARDLLGAVEATRQGAMSGAFSQGMAAREFPTWRLDSAAVQWIDLWRDLPPEDASCEALRQGGAAPASAGPAAFSGEGEAMSLAIGAAASYDKNVLESNGLVRWIHENLSIDGLDRESAGLAAAATEESIPWFAFGPCDPFMDGFSRARMPGGCWPDAQSANSRIAAAAIEFLRLTQRYPRPG